MLKASGVCHQDVGGQSPDLLCSVAWRFIESFRFHIDRLAWTERPDSSRSSSTDSRRAISHLPSGQMVDPVISLYLAWAGYSSSLIGVTIAAFSVMSFSRRPFAGRGVDASNSACSELAPRQGNVAYTAVHASPCSSAHYRSGDTHRSRNAARGARTRSG